MRSDSARSLDAVLRQRVNLALQPRNQVDLRRVERDGREPQPGVLVEYEYEIREQQSALQDWQIERLADEATDRLGLGNDHRNDLAGRHRLELGQREQQHLLIQLVAEPPHRPLADDAPIHVEPVLDRAVHGDQREQQHRERKQVRNLGDLEPDERRRHVLAADRAVDDALRDLEGDVNQREADGRDDEQQDLVPPAMPQDIAEDRSFQGDR